MTRKEFVLNVVEEMGTNPRAVLAGHGIAPAVLQEILERPDIMSKLATVLYSTKYAKKGAKGLKKQSNFKITGYKNFPDFNLKAREDVENFIGGLDANDAASFTNANNILTILMLPQEKADEDLNDEAKIYTGKSVALTFDSSVRKEYKVPGGIYLTVMMGDSVARPAEEKAAKRKSRVNKKKQNKRTPAKIRMELKSKANKKLAVIKNKTKALEEKATNTALEMQQFAAIGDEFGASAKTPSKVFGAINKHDATVKEMKAIVAGLDSEQKAAYKYAMKAAAAGDKKRMNMWLKELENEDLVNYIKGGAVGDSKSILKARKAELNSQLEQLAERNQALLEQLETETDPKKKLSIRSMISKNGAKTKQIRAKLGTYKNLSFAGVNKKAAMLKEVHEKIEENIAMGETITNALDDALMALDAKEGEKKVIKEQIMQQVADGMPMQYATQQAIQDNLSGESTTLSGNKEIKDLVDNL